jgi:carbon storage regulator
MLVLSRQRDETIMIGDDIEITIVDIRGDKVRLGITAPKSVQVHRKEVYDAIKRENREASQMNADDLSQAQRKLRPPPPEGGSSGPSGTRPNPERKSPGNGASAGNGGDR